VRNFLPERLRPLQWRVDAAGPQHAAALAALHSASFARGWSTAEVAALLAQHNVLAERLRASAQRDAFDGFALSRMAVDEAEILSVAVAQRWRGRGGSVPLLSRHLGRLLAFGVRRVVLEVDADNQPALGLYARFGFEEVGRREAYYPRPGGGFGTALVMARALG
jgi:ribosomal-protein-alanine N-acetyltransferase